MGGGEGRGVGVGVRLRWSLNLPNDTTDPERDEFSSFFIIGVASLLGGGAGPWRSELRFAIAGADWFVAVAVAVDGWVVGALDSEMGVL